MKMENPWRVDTIALLTGVIIIINPSALADYQETPGPIISPHENEIILQKGQNFTLKCRGRTPIEFKQQSIGEEGYGASFTMTHRNVSSDTDMFEIALDLITVDQYTVGYYACFDNTVNSSEILNYVMQEPNNTDHVTYLYIYVNGTDSLLVPMAELITTRRKGPILIGCKPTMPDVNITLQWEIADFVDVLDYEQYYPKFGFIVDSEVFPEGVTIIHCDLLKPDIKTTPKQIFIDKCVNTMAPKPIIYGTKYFLQGETFSLNCTVPYQRNVAVGLLWDLPPKTQKDNSIRITGNENEVTNDEQFLSKVLTVTNATKDHAGEYTCTSINVANKYSKQYEMKYIEQPFITLTKMADGIMELTTSTARISTTVKAHPYPKFEILRDYKVKIVNSSKTSISKYKSGDSLFIIRNLNIKDTGNYTLIAYNDGATANVTYDIRVIAAPIVNFGSGNDIKRLLNQTISFICEATGYPLPEIRWNYTSTQRQQENIVFSKVNEYTVNSTLTIPARISENITCIATKNGLSDHASRQLIIYELEDGFGIIDSPEWTPAHQDVSLKCLASKYDFQNLTWFGYEDLTSAIVEYSENSYSYVAVLKIYSIELNGTRNYTCVGYAKTGDKEVKDSQTIALEVAEIRQIIFDEPKTDIDQEVSYYQPVQFNCQADAVPRPHIEWYKDGSRLDNDTDGILIMDYNVNETVFNSTIVIAQMKEENIGKYECVAIKDNLEERKYINVVLKERSPYTTTYISIIGVIFLALLVLVIYLTCKVRREKRLRKELAAAGLLYFKEGVTKSLNPDLVVDDQAELLPYDDRFEFPPEKLFLGKQLGAGAFGVVYKAEARGIINAEDTNTVAVKMVKKTADNMYIKALASELKIMVHLGKHVNIVNLLGACTKNVGKRELIVIVEYCRFGNIHNYVQKHREVFIDQLTDNKEKNQGRINRGYSSSSASSGMHSDYFGSNHTQATDHTCLNTTNTTRSGRRDKPNQQVECIKGSEGYVQPEWRSNYESDYQSLAPRPLFSRDLLAWAFQIARGMEYLASRKVLHGDLAARNILLADDNVVKICDFGLARSIYKNDEYQKKENSPLPVKWLAIECMMDRIFSTQSDVWSFGIVLWELFSLAKTPYPNMSPQSLLQYLSDGHRLEKPAYADDRLYDVMMKCWEHKPTLRPSFSQLQEILGSFLEDNVRNHYVDLNSSCMDMNAKNERQEDYLAMMSAPDYNNLVTPSPHHYVNEVRSFFPPSPNTIPHDEEGYLQMTPVNKAVFSPMSTNTKFDFDARKMNTRMSEPSNCGSELTPMLTLNNLPAKSGSESDQEGSHSPYLNMCPRIEEETDEVFETKANNAKNIQNSAVTNPTYITFDVDGEKKSHNMKNTYINMPTGLVK